MNRGSAAAAAADCDSSASDCERDAAEEARIDELMRRRGWSRVPTKKQREAQCFKTRAFLALCCIAYIATTCACVAIARYDPTSDTSVDPGPSLRTNSTNVDLNAADGDGGGGAGGGLDVTSKPMVALPKARRHHRRPERRARKQQSWPAGED